MNILAASGGFRPGGRTRVAPGPLIDFAVQLAGSPSRPRFCYVGTANGDSVVATSAVYEAFIGRDAVVSHLALFPMPNVADVRAHLLAQDVIWVGGGSVAGLLSLWRLHGVDEVMREAWAAGVVLAGVSAGSLCWHVGGTTDSFGPALQAVTGGLALVPFSNSVHYDSEQQRRPLFHQLVGDGTLPAGFATDDGVGLHYRGCELVDVVADTPGRAAYRIEPDGHGGVVETPIEPRLLGGRVGADGRRPGPALGATSPAAAVTAINEAWTGGRTDDLTGLLHAEMVIVGPALERLAVGREECLRSYADFAKQATIVEYAEAGRAEQRAGDTAVIGYGYTLVYERAGERRTDIGHDLLVLTRTAEGWQAIWRMVVPGDKPE